MTISLSIFLYIYLFLAGSIFLFFLANLYNLARYGVLNFHTLLVSFIFIAGIVIIIYFSYQRLAQVDWHESVTIFKHFNIKNPPNILPFNQ
ncbi:hypothetical protein J7K86_01535 [bacterium]|nr:hypothetical protein [bacterium]